MSNSGRVFAAGKEDSRAAEESFGGQWIEMRIHLIPADTSWRQAKKAKAATALLLSKSFMMAALFCSTLE
jgi:hypothetical protein